jgi:hypothetical protein
MSAKGKPHCDRPAMTSAFPALLAEAATRFHSELANIILAKTFAQALIVPVAIITELLVAALSSGFRTVPFGIRKFIGWKVALEMGRSKKA